MKDQTQKKDPKTFADEIFSHVLELPSGKVVTFKDATAKDAAHARLIIGDDKTDVEFALLEVCAKINGEQAFMSDFAALSLKDYNELLPEFQKVNF